MKEPELRQICDALCASSDFAVHFNLYLPLEDYVRLYRDIFPDSPLSDRPRAFGYVCETADATILAIRPNERPEIRLT